jgi:hypothetical protein
MMGEGAPLMAIWPCTSMAISRAVEEAMKPIEITGNWSCRRRSRDGRKVR